MPARVPGRDAALLDPNRDPARVRAMYTHPDYKRRGVGRLILSLCEQAARAEGFVRAELVATMAGEPLYKACGYREIERFSDDRGGIAVPSRNDPSSGPGCSRSAACTSLKSVHAYSASVQSGFASGMIQPLPHGFV